MKKTGKVMLTVWVLLAAVPVWASDSPKGTEQSVQALMRGEKNSQTALENFTDTSLEVSAALVYLMTWIITSMDKQIKEQSDRVLLVQQAGDGRKIDLETQKLREMSERRAQVARLFMEAIRKAGQQMPPAQSLGR